MIATLPNGRESPRGLGFYSLGSSLAVSPSEFTRSFNREAQEERAGAIDPDSFLEAVFKALRWLLCNQDGAGPIQR
jgi:hypothetical protein